MPCFGEHPVAEPRGAAGSRSNIIISVRRERPSSSVRESCPFRFGVVSLGPVYGWHLLEVATAASRRRRRVGLIAGRSADQRCWVGRGPRARESMDKEEERATPDPLTPSMCPIGLASPSEGPQATVRYRRAIRPSPLNGPGCDRASSASRPRLFPALVTTKKPSVNIRNT